MAVHQRCAGGATEGLSVHYFRTMVEDDHLGLTPIQHCGQDSVQDAFVIFGPHSFERVRFGQHARVLGHGRSRSSKPQARVSYESATAPKRHKKDPNRPRGYISAFNFFVKDKRPTYVQGRPNAQVRRPCSFSWKPLACFPCFGDSKRSNECLESGTLQGHSLEHNNEINKMLGKVWKTATEHEKKTYEEKATADKVRYLKVCLTSLCCYRRCPIFFLGPCTLPFNCMRWYLVTMIFIFRLSQWWLPAAFFEDVFCRNNIPGTLLGTITTKKTGMTTHRRV